jgi:glutathione peroxidase
MFAKSSVSGSNPNPLFKMLIAKTGTTPKWNFYKYLIDRNGNVVNSFGSITKPTSTSITNQVEKLLEEKAQWAKKDCHYWRWNLWIRLRLCSKAAPWY